MSTQLSVLRKRPEFGRSAALALGGLAWLWAGAWVVSAVGVSDEFALGLAGVVSYALLWLLPTAGLFVFAGIEVNKVVQDLTRERMEDHSQL